MAPLLQVNNLSKEYGGKVIFSGLSFSVFAKQKIGIIGRNGAGKSTLFRIILGQEQADGGEVMISSEARIGSIEQSADHVGQESAIDYLVRKSGKEDWRCRQVASRFRFDAAKLGLPVASLSGGWQMRLRLTAMLLLEPNLFLLDEPTNYLDLRTLLLLEDFLKTYPGGFLVISHDREFLKNTCTETMEITSRRCIAFPQPLEAYLAYKEQRAQTERKINEKIRHEQKNMQAFVDRFRYKASKATQAQALIKKIDKLEAHKISIEHNAGNVRISMPMIERRKNRLLSIDEMAIGYDSPLVSGIDLEIKGGEKAILVGDNGQGKTTLLRTIIGAIAPLSGRYTWFAGLKIGYFDQLSTANLNQDEQVGDYLNRMSHSSLKTEKVLQMAGDFLFSGDDIKKPLGVLSGGERSRLVLAGLLLGKPDVLLLDEPNNHLDFETVEALALALKGYNGAVIFTSHDRTFANLVAEKVIELDNGYCSLRYHDYEGYIYQLEKRLAEDRTKENLAGNGPKGDKAVYQEDKEKKKRIKAIEKRLEKLSVRKEEIFKYFLDNPLSNDLGKRSELESIAQESQSLEEEWINLNYQ